MSTAPTLESLQADIERLQRELKDLQAGTGSSDPREDTVSIVCFSGDWDRLFAAFTIANGALALGQEVHMFFTFWGATAVRRPNSLPEVSQNWMQKMMGRMLPQSIEGAKLSKMHFFGLGKWMMGILMKQKQIQDLPEMMEDARELGAEFHYCDTSIGLFGWGNRDLVDGDPSKWCGVSTFLATALKGKITLFI